MLYGSYCCCSWCCRCRCCRIYYSLAFCVVGYILISFMVLHPNMLAQNINWCMPFVVSDSIISWHCSLSVNMKNGALHQRYGKHNVHKHIVPRAVLWAKWELRGKRNEEWLENIRTTKLNETKQNCSLKKTDTPKTAIERFFFAAHRKKTKSHRYRPIHRTVFIQRKCIGFKASESF